MGGPAVHLGRRIPYTNCTHCDETFIISLIRGHDFSLFAVNKSNVNFYKYKNHNRAKSTMRYVTLVAKIDGTQLSRFISFQRTFRANRLTDL
jgi:hypothetical protein